MNIQTSNTDIIQSSLQNFILASERTSHSFIVLGNDETDKGQTVRLAAQKILETKELESHPNVLWMDNRTKNITVEHIRAISKFLYQTSYDYELPKLIVIDHAHNLTVHSLNALLKMTEEPLINSYFILIASNTTKIPDTLRSRCITINISPEDTSVIRKEIKEKFPYLSSKDLDEYFTITSSKNQLIDLISNNVLEIYKQILYFMDKNLYNQLFQHIEYYFPTILGLDLCHILIKNLIHKALKTNQFVNTAIIPEEAKIVKKLSKDIKFLLKANKDIDFMTYNSKILGLNVTSVVLVMFNKIKCITI